MITPEDKTITYDLAAELFKKGDKFIPKDHADWGECALEYACDVISVGQSLHDVLPKHPETGLPTLRELKQLIEIPANNIKLNQATELRIWHIQERFVSIMNKMKTKEDIEELKALRVGLEEMLQNISQTIIINYDSIFKLKLWDDVVSTAKKQMMDRS